MMLSDVCLSVAYIVNFYGAHSYWTQGVLGPAGVRRVWAATGPHRAQGQRHIAQLPAQLVINKHYLAHQFWKKSSAKFCKYGLSASIFSLNTMPFMYVGSFSRALLM